MGKFRVHLYPVVRVVVDDVEAENQVEAIKKAEAILDLHSLLSIPDVGEYADDIDCFLVDEIGDDGFLNSRWYDKHGESLNSEPGKPKMVIFVNRGLIDEVITDKAMDYIVFDEDCQDADEELQITDFENGYTLHGSLTEYESEGTPDKVEHYWNQIPAM